MGEERLRISVVVPTRERPEELRRCLAALGGQSVPSEIVVVEDSEGRGPAWARNEGVRRAQGEVICFTDDDCEPSRGWAEALAAPILAGQAEATAGPMVVGEGATAADRAWKTIVSYLQQQATAPGTNSPGFAATANLACSRSLLERLPFDESFPTAAGEDRDWADRAAREGTAPVFAPGAIVVHQPGLRMRDFLRQQYRYGRGAARYRHRAEGRSPGSPRFYAGLLRAGLEAGIAPGVMVCLAQIATVAGAITESVSVPLIRGLRQAR